MDRTELLTSENQSEQCVASWQEILQKRKLVIAANRGPVTIHTAEQGDIYFQKGGGGLVTALSGLIRYVDATWIASALSDEDRTWREGRIPLDDTSDTIQLKFLTPGEEEYAGYYHVISNPLLWFLQHSLWDYAREPNIVQSTWDAWNKGYVEVNRMFGEAISSEIRNNDQPTLVMLQDYHLYLAPRYIRRSLGHKAEYTLLHFIHIPWPGPDDWGLLPPQMRNSILDSLCAIDLLGFQTREDGLNFIRTCESFLKGARVNYRQGRIRYRNHFTYIRDFPISIDIDALKQMVESEDVKHYVEQFKTQTGDRRLIVRIDRTEPSKNIVRGFNAYEELLEQHPEYTGKVQFLALFVPSRLQVEQYQNYLDELMAAAGRVNAKIGSSEWEPVRVLIGEDYPRAIAALTLYDVLFINPIADGMNLVAKEGPIVNQKDGVLILSEKAGAQQQLGHASLVISPVDIVDTVRAFHLALSMPPEERKERAMMLRKSIEAADITGWLCDQLNAIVQLGL